MRQQGLLGPVGHWQTMESHPFKQHHQHAVKQEKNGVKSEGNSFGLPMSGLIGTNALPVVVTSYEVVMIGMAYFSMNSDNYSNLFSIDVSRSIFQFIYRYRLFGWRGNNIYGLLFFSPNE
tara:strand:- start:182 stop:541 length:360 start_codon:yes stop_codon:yes gene_type:complete